MRWPSIVLLLPSLAAAQPAPEATTRPLDESPRRTQDPPPLGTLGPQPEPGRFNPDDHLLRDPAGLRARLDDRGVRVGGTLFADALQVLDGPDERFEYRLLATADAEFDLNRLIGLPDATAFARLYFGLDSDKADMFPVTVQAIDAVPAFEHVVLGELWFEQRFADDRLRLRGGRMDANTEFAVTEYATLIVTDSAAISPTFVGIPSFLDPALGVTLFAYPGDLSFGVGLYRGDLDAPGDGALLKATFFDAKLTGDSVGTYAIAEAGYLWDVGPLPGQIKLGGYILDGSYARFDGTRDDLIGGGYLILQQALYDEGDGLQGLGAFAQFGLADDAYAAAGNHAALGLVYRGPLAGRDADRLGLYVSRAGLSDADGAGFYRGSETIVEATYAIEVTPAVLIQPDVQYIRNAAGEDRDVVLGVLRVAVTF